MCSKTEIINILDLVSLKKSVDNEKRNRKLDTRCLG